MTSLPDRFDRTQLDRILQRAAELQTGERELGDELSSEEILSLGREVGIPERHLRQAILEEGTRTPQAVAAGWTDALVGPAVVTAQRVVQGDPDAVEAALVHYLETHELLQLQRQQRGRVSWEPLRGWQRGVKRSSAAFGAKPRAFLLQRAELVSATLVPLEPGFVHVALEARLAAARGRLLAAGVLLVALGATSSGILAVLGAPLLAAGIPGVLTTGAAWLTGRTHRPAAARAQLGLEVALDHLERGASKPAHELPPRPAGGFLGLILDEVRKGIEGARVGETVGRETRRLRDRSEGRRS